VSAFDSELLHIQGMAGVSKSRERTAGPEKQRAGLLDTRNCFDRVPNDIALAVDGFRVVLSRRLGLRRREFGNTCQIPRVRLLEHGSQSLIAALNRLYGSPIDVLSDQSGRLAVTHSSPPPLGPLVSLPSAGERIPRNGASSIL
jgi:hypothetical protein